MVTILITAQAQCVIKDGLLLFLDAHKTVFSYSHHVGMSVIRNESAFSYVGGFVQHRGLAVEIHRHNEIFTTTLAQNCNSNW